MWRQRPFRHQFEKNSISFSLWGGSDGVGSLDALALDFYTESRVLAGAEVKLAIATDTNHPEFRREVFALDDLSSPIKSIVGAVHFLLSDFSDSTPSGGPATIPIETGLARSEESPTISRRMFNGFAKRNVSTDSLVLDILGALSALAYRQKARVSLVFGYRLWKAGVRSQIVMGPFVDLPGPMGAAKERQQEECRLKIRKQRHALSTAYAVCSSFPVLSFLSYESAACVRKFQGRPRWAVMEITNEILLFTAQGVGNPYAQTRVPGPGASPYSARDPETL